MSRDRLIYLHLTDGYGDLRFNFLILFSLPAISFAIETRKSDTIEKLDISDFTDGRDNKLQTDY